MEISLNPCIRITSDTIGKPGQRVFYIQGATLDEQSTVIIEKIQLQTLSASILHFLDELQKSYPELEIPSGQYTDNTMQISLPVDPIFRVGEIGLAYNRDLDQSCLIVKRIEMETNSLQQDETEEMVNVINFWCSREQLKALANWGLQLVQKGRPICPLCHEPIDPSGHFCPKKNGHSKH